jgi:ribonuclease HI
MIYLYCDGACRGNPGLSSVGVYAYKEKPEVPVFTISKAIGKGTNNEAEWTSLILGLEKCLELGEKVARVYMDSQLVVEQANGRYKTKKPELKVFKSKFEILQMSFQKLEIEHIPREKNAKADKLANAALD